MLTKPVQVKQNSRLSSCIVSLPRLPYGSVARGFCFNTGDVSLSKSVRKFKPVLQNAQLNMCLGLLCDDEVIGSVGQFTKCSDTGCLINHHPVRGVLVPFYG